MMKQLKVIAFYLPQYHETVENNEWWGKGFTEWTNVRKAKPLYEGHLQPKVPLDNNYYCLLDEKTQVWQAEIAKKYGVYGFCYYHYWFNGKMLIEKPMEKMLQNPAVDIPFCVSWANEPWTRTWTGKEKEVLMPQVYGGEADWKAHIEYLIPFFKDSRYIKKDNKPIMLLYRAGQITDCDDMIVYWNEYLQKEGFDGIYIIETLSGNQPVPALQKAEATVEMEPMLTVKSKMSFWARLKKHLIIRWRLWRFGILDVVNYDVIWKSILRRSTNGDKVCYRGAFSDWDNSARRQEKGMMIKGASPAKFEKYFGELVKQCREANQEFLFFNAWNEWGEGAYLEPDEHYGYGYLEAIKRVMKDKEDSCCEEN